MEEEKIYKKKNNERKEKKKVERKERGMKECEERNMIKKKKHKDARK